MDDADRAEIAQQRALDAAIAAARGVRTNRLPRTHCSDCGDALQPHRRDIGRCVPCQADLERRERMRGR